MKKYVRPQTESVVIENEKPYLVTDSKLEGGEVGGDLPPGQELDY